MEMPTRPFLAMTATILAVLLFSTVAQAQQADVSRSKSPLVTIQIGGLDEIHTVPLIAYQALVRQGVPTRLLSGPPETTIRPNNRPVLLANPAPSAPNGTDPLTMTGWTVGVFR